MARAKQIARGTGKVFLILLGVILMPILISVGLGMTIGQRVQGKKLPQKPAPTIGEILAAAGLTIHDETTGDEAMAAKRFRQPISEIHQLIARAGLIIHDETAPKHCWEILHCSSQKRDACPVYSHRDVPGWVAKGLAKGGQVNPEASDCTLLG